MDGKPNPTRYNISSLLDGTISKLVVSPNVTLTLSSIYYLIKINNVLYYIQSLI